MQSAFDLMDYSEPMTAGGVTPMLYRHNAKTVTALILSCSVSLVGVYSPSLSPEFLLI